jgi:hypothetical protein
MVGGFTFPGMDWQAVIPPLVGALVGALLNGMISTLVAMLVVFRTRDYTRELANEAAGIAAAEAIAVALEPVVEVFTDYHYRRAADWSPDATARLREFRRVLFVKLAAISDDSMRRHIRQAERACAEAMTRTPDHPIQRGKYIRVVGDAFSQLSTDVYDWRLSRKPPDTTELLESLEKSSQAILAEPPPRIAGPLGR